MLSRQRPIYHHAHPNYSIQSVLIPGVCHFCTHISTHTISGSLRATNQIRFAMMGLLSETMPSIVCHTGQYLPHLSLFSCDHTLIGFYLIQYLEVLVLLSINTHPAKQCLKLTNQSHKLPLLIVWSSRDHIQFDLPLNYTLSTLYIYQGTILHLLSSTYYILKITTNPK